MRPAAGRLLLAGAVVVLAWVAVLAAAWVFTPPVGDLEGRIAARLGAHSAADPRSLPTPDRVGQALVATEDSRFFSHHGIDPQGALRGLIGTVTGNELAGGATLDQQLAKVIYTPRRDGLAAKLEQIVLGIKIDHAYSKGEILQAYLASVYFGHGYFGLDAAAHGYFGLDPAELDWAQASLVAGLVQAPSAYDPVLHLELAKQRQRQVLDRLVATGVLSVAQAQTAYAAPLGLAP
ncbi:MAG: transglycosylase domain-containing protein [Pseudonocardiaceae bacterium]